LVKYYQYLKLTPVYSDLRILSVLYRYTNQNIMYIISIDELCDQNCNLNRRLFVLSIVQQAPHVFLTCTKNSYEHRIILCLMFNFHFNKMRKSVSKRIRSDSEIIK